MGRQLALLRVILLILLIGWLAPALSQPAGPEPVHLTASTRQLDLAGRMSYLIDPTGKLTLDQVMAQRAAGAFVLGSSSEDLFLGAYFGIMSLAFLISGFRTIRYRSPVDRTLHAHVGARGAHASGDH